MTSRDQGARRARKFGHLRSLVHGTQTPGTWQAISAMLGSWPAEELAEVLVYVEHGLRAWPASLRVMPNKPKVLSSWLERPALWRLIGALRLSSPRELERYLDGDWSGLRLLKLSIDSDIAQWIALLGQWERCGAVTSLELSVTTFDVAPLLKTLSRLPWRLEAWSLNASAVHCDEELSEVWAGEWLARLKCLEFSLMSRAILGSVYKAIQQGAFGALEVFRIQDGVIFSGLVDLVDAPIWFGLKEFSHICPDGWLVLEGLSRAGATPRVLELQLPREYAQVRLMSAPLLEGLERVKLSHSPILSQVLPPIVEHASQLRSLTLHSGQLLGEPPALTGLAQLDELFLDSTHVERSWSEWFVRQGCITRLSRLHIFHASRPAEQLLPMIEALYEPGEPLRALSLAGCGLNVQQLHKIVDSGRLERCEKLVLSHNSFNSLSRLALMDLFLDPARWSALRHLSIRLFFHIFAPDDVRLLRARFHQVAI